LRRALRKDFRRDQWDPKGMKTWIRPKMKLKRMMRKCVRNAAQIVKMIKGRKMSRRNLSRLHPRVTTLSIQRRRRQGSAKGRSSNENSN
jgi:hypothetical protein